MYSHLHNMRYVDNDHPKQKKCFEEKNPIPTQPSPSPPNKKNKNKK